MANYTTAGTQQALLMSRRQAYEDNQRAHGENGFIDNTDTHFYATNHIKTSAVNVNTIATVAPKSYESEKVIPKNTQRWIKNFATNIVNPMLKAWDQTFSEAVTSTGPNSVGININPVTKAQILAAKIHYTPTMNFGVKVDTNDQKSLMERIVKTGRFMQMDTEGIGNAITEFSFASFSGADIKDPKAQLALKDSAQAFIGLGGDDLKKAKQLVRDAKAYSSGDLKGSISEADRYQLQSLQKLGSNKTTFGRNKKTGLYYLTSYASDEDVNYLNWDDIDRGLQIAEKTFNDTRNLGVTEITLNLPNGVGMGAAPQQTFKVYHDEAEIFRMFFQSQGFDIDYKKDADGKILGYTFKNQSDDNRIAIAGLNVMGYDNPMMKNKLLNGSEGARSLFYIATGGTGDMIRDHQNRVNMFDVTANMRALNPGMIEDQAQAVVDANTAMNKSLGLTYRYLDAPEKVAAEVQRLAGGKYVQHAAFSDTIGQGITLFGMMRKIFDPDQAAISSGYQYLFKDLEVQRTANVGDLFFAKNGMFKNASGTGLSGIVDSVTGEFRFNGINAVTKSGQSVLTGAAVDMLDPNNEVRQDIVTTQGLKNGTVGMYLGTQRLNLIGLPSAQRNKLLKQWGKASGSSLNDIGGDLFVTYFTPYGKPGVGGKNISFFVGTEQQTSEYLGNQIYAGRVSKENIIRSAVQRAHNNAYKFWKKAKKQFNGYQLTEESLSDINGNDSKATKYFSDALAHRYDVIESWNNTHDYGKIGLDNLTALQYNIYTNKFERDAKTPEWVAIDNFVKSRKAIPIDVDKTKNAFYDVVSGLIDNYRNTLNGLPDIADATKEDLIKLGIDPQTADKIETSIQNGQVSKFELESVIGDKKTYSILAKNFAIQGQGIETSNLSRDIYKQINKVAKSQKVNFSRYEKQILRDSVYDLFHDFAKRAIKGFKETYGFDKIKYNKDGSVDMSSVNDRAKRFLEQEKEFDPNNGLNNKTGLALYQELASGDYNVSQVTFKRDPATGKILKDQNGKRVVDEENSVPRSSRKRLGAYQSSDKYKAAQILADTQERAETASTSDWIRRQGYTGTTRILAFLDEMNSFATSFYGLKGTADAKQIRQVSEMILNGYSPQAIQIAKSKQGLTDQEIKDRQTKWKTIVLDTLGYNFGGKHVNPISNTIVNAVKASEYFAENKDIFKKALEITKKFVSAEDPSDFKNEVFDRVLGNMRAAITNAYLNTLNQFAYDDYFKNVKKQNIEKVQKGILLFDISPLIGKTKSTTNLPTEGAFAKYLDIDLNETSPHWVTRIMSATGIESRIEAVRAFATLLKKQNPYNKRAKGEYYAYLKRLDKIVRGPADADWAMSEINNVLKWARLDIGQPYDIKDSDGKVIQTINRISNTDFGIVPKNIAPSFFNYETPDEALKWFHGLKSSGDQDVIDLIYRNAQELNVKFKRAIGEGYKSDNKTKRTYQESASEDLAKSIKDWNESKIGKQVSEKKLRDQYGFDHDQAKRIMQDFNDRMRDTEEYVKKLLSPIFRDNRITYIYDKESNRLVLVDSTTGYKRDISNLIPTEQFDERTGTFVTMFGGRKLATEKTFDVAYTRQDGSAVFDTVSNIKRLTNLTEGHLRGVNNARRSLKQRIDYLSWAINNQGLDEIAKNSINYFDAEDVRLSRSTSFIGFIERAAYLYKIGAFENVQLKDATKNVLDRLAGKDGKLEKAKNDYEARYGSLDGFTYATPNLKTSDIATLYNDLETLASPLNDPKSKASLFLFQNDDEARRNTLEALKGLRRGQKHPEYGYLTDGPRTATVFGMFGEDNRHIQSVVSRSKYMDAEKLDEETKSVVLQNSLLETSYYNKRRENRQIADASKKIADSLRVEKVTINTDVWHKLLAQHVKSGTPVKGNGYDITDLKQLFTYLNESGSMVDPRLLEAMQRNIIQKVNTKDTMDIMDTAVILGKDAAKQQSDIIKKTRAVFADNNGVPIFQYYDKDNPILVQKDDVIAYDKSYRNTGHVITADREGFLTRRYYDVSGEVVGAGKITEILRKDQDFINTYNQVREDFSKGERQKNEAQAILDAKAKEILTGGKYKYSERYAVEGTSPMTFKKVLDTTEKSEAEFPIASLGEFDTKIQSIVGKDSNIRIDFNIIKDPKKLEAYLQTHEYLGENEDLVKKVKQAGFGDYEDFVKAARKERSAYFDAALTILAQGANISKDILKNTKVISATLMESKKSSHMETPLIESGLNDAVTFAAEQRMKDLKAKGTDISFQDAAAQVRQEIFKRIQKDNVFLDKNGNNLVKDTDTDITNESLVFNPSELYQINVQKLGKIIHDYTNVNPDRFFTITDAVADNLGLSAEERKEFLGKTLFSRSTANLFSVADADEVGMNDGHNGKGIKLTRRLMQNMGQEIVDVQSSQALIKSYQGLIDAGQDADHILQVFNYKFKDTMGIEASLDQNNKLILANPDQISLPGQGMRRVNQGIIDNMMEEIFLSGRGRIEFDWDLNDWTSNGENFFDTKEAENLEAIGMSRKSIRSVLEGFGQSGVNAISYDTLANMYAYNTQNAAWKFNEAMKKAKDPAEQEKLLKSFLTANEESFGKKANNIMDLHMDSDRFIDNDTLNPLTRAGVVDLGPEVAAGTPRYIAYGFNNASVMDNNDHDGVYSKDNVREKLYALRSAIERNNNQEQRLQGDITDVLRNGAADLVDAVHEGATTKTGVIGDLTSGYLTGSGTFKASLIRTTGESLENPLLKNAIIKDGEYINGMGTINSMKMSLADHMKAGHKINATFLSRGVVENALKSGDMSNALKDIGKNLGIDLDINSFNTKKALYNFNSQGGAVGIQLRQPAEYQVSMSGSHIYIDDDLQDNEAKITDMTGVGEKADQDGDLIYAAMARARVDINGNSYRLNQIQIQALEQMNKDRGLGLNIRYKAEAFQPFAASADFIGSASLSGAVDNALTDFSDGDIKQILTKANEATVVDVAGRIYNIDNLNSSEKALKLQYAKENILTGDNEAYVQAAAQYLNDNGKGKYSYDPNIGKANMTDEEWKDYSSEILSHVDSSDLGVGKIKIGQNEEVYHNSIINNYMMRKYGQAGNESFNWDALPDQNTKAAAGKEAEALATYMNEENLNAEVNKTILRKDAGLINMNTYRFKGILQAVESQGISNGLTSGDAAIIGQMIAHINEAGQAPKNATAAESGLENIGTAMEKFFGVLQDGAGRRNKNDLYGILDNLVDLGVKEFKNLPVYDDIDKDRFKTDSEYTKQRVHEAFDHILADDQGINKKVYESFRIGYAQSGIAEEIMAQDTNDPLRRMQIISNAITEDSGWQDALIKDAPLTETVDASKPVEGIGLDNNNFVGNFAAPEGNLSDAIRGTIKSVREKFHGHGAMAMLGFAGLTMMSGMIGGAPTAPQPSDQAQGISQENAMYEIPSTMSGQGTGSGANQSYIININAATSKGRDFGERAIRQAFENMPQSSKGGVNMTMNIKDSSSNIDFRDVANYISTIM